MAPSPAATTNEPGTVLTLPTMLLFVGSICTTVPCESAASHTPLGSTAMPPSLFPIVVGMLAITLFVETSIRSMRAAPQQGTHKLSNPSPSPEQGESPTEIFATTLF